MKTMFAKEVVELFRTRTWTSAILPAVVAVGYSVVSKGINYLDQTRDIERAALFTASVLVAFLVVGRARSKVAAPWPLIALSTSMLVSLLLSPFPVVE